MSVAELLDELSRVPSPAYAGLSALVFFVLLILQTVHWAALRASFSFETSLPKRLVIQMACIPLAAFLFYVLVTNPHLVQGAAAFIRTHAGADIEGGFSAAFSRALSSGDYVAGAAAVIVRGLVLVAGVYAVALFVSTGILAPRVGLLRNLIASVLASALLFGSVHLLAQKANVHIVRGNNLDCVDGRCVERGARDDEKAIAAPGTAAPARAPSAQRYAF